MKSRVCVLGAALLALLGCAHQQTRLQAPDENYSEKENEAQTIGDVTSFANADPIPVSGVGVVVGLDGTGGDAPPGSYRTFLEDQLRKDRVEHIKEILSSPNNSMVLVSALIPPGAHKNDSIDVEVCLPAHSKTSSLRGGYLKECYLFNYDSTKNLNPNYGGSNKVLKGHILAKAEGPVMVGFGNDKDNLVVGQIWGGGRSKIDRTFYVVLNKDQQNGPMVQRIAERINQTFHGPFKGSMSEVAVAQTKSFLVLKVPLQYHYNLPRYLRIVRLIPLLENPAADDPYRAKLEADLLDPTRTVTAALRLEALGNPSMAALKRGLHSAHPLVRFASAEALAYLGIPACGEQLALLVENQPRLRAFSLTALASLDEAISHVKLRELLSSPDPETKYGAFRALRALDEHDSAVQGEFLNDSFWLHHVTPGSPPLVHLSTSRRPEVVIFGDEVKLLPPFSFLAGEFTLTAAHADSRCTISRLSVQHGSQRRQCALQLDDVLHALADMGALYPDVVEFLQQTGKFHCLTCAVAIDALPRAISVYDLAKDGAKNSPLPGTDSAIIEAGEALGATPTLFEKAGGDLETILEKPSDAGLSTHSRKKDGQAPGLRSKTLE